MFKKKNKILTSQSGLTLVELLVSLVLFGILTASSSYIIYSLTSLVGQNQKSTKFIKQLLISRSLIKSDFFNIINREMIINSQQLLIVKTDDSISHARLSGSGKLIFAMQINDKASLRSVNHAGLKFIEYYLDKNNLIRREYNQIELIKAVNYHDQILFGGVENITIEFAGARTWQMSFRASFNVLVPRAIKVKFTMLNKKSFYITQPLDVPLDWINYVTSN